VQQAEVAPKLQISEDEAKAYYTGHQQEFATVPTVTLREILIKVAAPKPGSINVAADEAALETLKQVRARIMAGEDFGKVASEVSESASKANGGLIGPINRSEISPQLLKLLDSMAVGQLTDPIRTVQGYQILKLETATTGAVQPFDQVRDLVADKVYEQKSQAEFTKYLDKLRAQAIIEWKSPELKKLYETHLAELQKGAPAS